MRTLCAIDPRHGQFNMGMIMPIYIMLICI